MKLFDGGRAPNPRRVRIFLAEKKIPVSLVTVNMARGEHREESIAALNPMRKLPILQLDDGTVIAESIAICRYFEELQPEPALFGRTPLEKAFIEMWQRRLELHLFIPVTQIVGHLNPALKTVEVPQIPMWGEANKSKVMEFLQILDTELSDRQFVAGDLFSVADITGLVAIDFMKPARVSLPEHLGNVRRWHLMVASRCSAFA